MKTYLFNFNICPNDNSWWTTYNKESFQVTAKDLFEAENLYFEYLSNNLGFEISKTARKKYHKMYRDTKEGKSIQVGKVFKASTEIDFDRTWKKKFADVWTEINVLNNPFEA